MERFSRCFHVGFSWFVHYIIGPAISQSIKPWWSFSRGKPPPGDWGTPGRWRRVDKPTVGPTGVHKGSNGYCWLPLRTWLCLWIVGYCTLHNTWVKWWCWQVNQWFGGAPILTHSHSHWFPELGWHDIGRVARHGYDQGFKHSPCLDIHHWCHVNHYNNVDLSETVDKFRIRKSIDPDHQNSQQASR